MIMVWDEQALIEADVASKFYQQKQSSLGKRFLDNLEDAVSRIAHHRLPTNGGQHPQVQVATLPYGVIYRIQIDTIQIIAVMHLRQEPRNWNQPNC